MEKETIIPWADAFEMYCPGGSMFIPYTFWYLENSYLPKAKNPTVDNFSNTIIYGDNGFAERFCELRPKDGNLVLRNHGKAGSADDVEQLEEFFNNVLEPFVRLAWLVYFSADGATTAKQVIATGAPTATTVSETVKQISAESGIDKDILQPIIESICTNQDKPKEGVNHDGQARTVFGIV